MSARLNNKVAIVTGAAQGIGQAIATRLGRLLAPAMSPIAPR
jgi:NAD(P)-dependent dehydrogenase (short-subunit alcohol dehydrogenase family)